MYIREELDRLSEGDFYPFHMPGHKRRMEDHPLRAAYERDITEIDGFDCLHEPAGIILEAMERAKRLYGTKESFFLVNGSTAGILAAIHTCVSYGEKIILARNSHYSAYNAAALLNLETVYLYPEEIPGWTMAGGISCEDVRRTISKNKDAKAILITSPTYEGFVSPIDEIAALAHEAGIPLIVDEAHGAHFPFSKAFPASALSQGADLVIQSLHKTMPALTQTAILHLQGELADVWQLKRFLKTFQSSSPSYLLLASIEDCLRLVEKRGERLWETVLGELRSFEEEVKKLAHIRVYTDRQNKDPLKLILECCNTTKNGKPYTGADLYQELLKQDHLQMEMAASDYALGILTCMDEPEGLRRLKKALFRIDRELNSLDGGFFEQKWKPVRSGEVKERIGKALTHPACWIDLTEAGGRESAGFISLYPPGIPLVVPGEVIREELVDTLLRYNRQNLPVQGCLGQKVKVIFCKKQEEKL